jgi:hypothetical protein
LSPELAALAIDAVYDSDLCVDGFLQIPAQSAVAARIRPDNGDVSLAFGDVTITAPSMMFRVRVSQIPLRPVGSTFYFANASDLRRWKVTSAHRKDSARLEWICLAQQVKQ